MSARASHQPALRAIRALALLVATLPACTLLAPGDQALSGGTAACVPGEGRCGDRCVSELDPAFGCGDPLCVPCHFPHARALCAAEGCALAACAAGFGDCDGRADDGCEVDLQAAPAGCGRCDISCGGASPLCVDAACVPRCHAIDLTAFDARLVAPSTGYDLGASDFTMELWLQVHALFGDGSVGELWALNAEDLRYATRLAIEAREADGSLLVDFALPDALPHPPHLPVRCPGDGAWHHLAFVRTHAALSGFVDGHAAGVLAMSPQELVAVTRAAIGRINATYPTAAPVRLGPMRLSRVARYASEFAPRTFWPLDGATVTQYLSATAFDGKQLLDEAGRDNDATMEQSVTGTSGSTPCP